MAHNLAKYVHGFSTQKSCAAYECKLMYYVGMWDCQMVSTYTSHYLCEFEDPVKDLTETLGTSIAPLVRPGNKVSAPHVTECPLGHVTHSFLACDPSSTCWASSESLTPESFDLHDVPSYAWCSAKELTSRPPAYACATGGGRVPYTWVCDHRQDCSDNSDEGFCRHPPCGGHAPLQCGNSLQVHSSRGQLHAGSQKYRATPCRFTVVVWQLPAGSQ